MCREKWNPVTWEELSTENSNPKDASAVKIQNCDEISWSKKCKTAKNDSKGEAGFAYLIQYLKLWNHLSALHLACMSITWMVNLKKANKKYGILLNNIIMLFQYLTHLNHRMTIGNKYYWLVAIISSKYSRVRGC